eukprot:SRR837773.11976.p2 GENE.SRR837773.11976~~SRR837773.11976.p2  ORF type:complete len:360 (-),score=168.96 SRR837773.11976:37-972(-)
MALTFLHMSVSLTMCLLLYVTKPALFPGMKAAEGKRMELLKWFVPIGIFFAIALYTSNRAYIYCDVAFLQFMKENNVMICFLLSCLVGCQSMDRLKFMIVFWVVATSAYTVGEELHFVWIGFILQAFSQLAECSRAVMGECVLTGAGLKLDPLSYTLFTAPICLVVLAVGTAATWEPAILTQGIKFWYLLVPNALLAFVLNYLVASVIKETSAVGFTMAGVLKDIFIVLLSAATFGEVVTVKQMVGFSGSILGIVLWSILKVQPNSDIIQRAYTLLGSAPATKGEQAKLNEKVPREYGAGNEPLVEASKAA